MAPRGVLWILGPKFAGSFYSQSNGLKLADIRHKRTLFLPLYSILSPHEWLSCGMAPRGVLWLPRAKISARQQSSIDNWRLSRSRAHKNKEISLNITVACPSVEPNQKNLKKILLDDNVACRPVETNKKPSNPTQHHWGLSPTAKRTTKTTKKTRKGAPQVTTSSYALFADCTAFFSPSSSSSVSVSSPPSTKPSSTCPCSMLARTSISTPTN
jgi:hypothetical protein